MKYEYKLDFDDYVSYLKMNFTLMKGKNKIDKRFIIGVILLYIFVGMSLRLLGLKLLSNIFIIFVGAILIFCSIILSNRVLSTNPKMVAKMMAKRSPDIIFAKRTLEIKDNELILHDMSSSQAINGKAIKDVIMDENIIGVVSIKDMLCAYIPVSVFKDENEKEEFIKVIKDIRSEDYVFDKKMDYSYRIDATDYANYIRAQNVSIKFNDGLKIFTIAILAIWGVSQVLKSIQYGYYKIAIINAIIYIAMIIIFYKIVNDNSLYEKKYLRASENYLKKNPDLLNEQQIKLEDDGVLYHMNNTTRKFGFSDIKKVILKNNTIVVLGKVDILLFMIPTHVFASEDERDKFIEILN